MIGNPVLNAELTEPPVRQIDLNLSAEPPLRGLRFDDALGLMSALVALENTCLQIFDGMRGTPCQMRIAVTLITAKRCNEFMILHNKGLLFHTSPRPSHGANAEPPRHPRRRRRPTR
jgi:hypothetical protein